MLLYELNTAFDHGLWDRYDYLSLVRKDGRLWDRDYQHRTTNYYSIPQDCFYALSGHRPLVMPDQPNLMFWHRVVNKDWFEKFQRVFNKGTDIAQIIAIHELTTVIEQGIEDEPEDEQMFSEEKISGGAEEDFDDDSGEGDSLSGQDGDDSSGDSSTGNNQEENNSSGGSGDGEDEKESDHNSQGSGDGSGSGQGHGNNHGTGIQHGDGSGSGDNGGSNKGDGSDQSGEDSSDNEESDEQTGNGNSSDLPEISNKIGPNRKRLNNSQRMENKAKRIADNLEQKVDAVEKMMDYIDPGASAESFSQNLHETINFVSSFDVKRMIKFFGFARNAVKGVHRSGDAAIGEMTSYRNSEWGKSVHPADMLGIAGKDPRTMLKVAESSLRVRKYEEEVPMGRGPVIFLRDESWSVKDIKGQMKELEIAMALAFNSEKRDFISIAWDARHSRMHVYGESSPIPHLEQFFGGGTLIFHALDLAFEKAEEYVKGTDIVVLTDGEIVEEHVTEEISEKMDKFKEDGGRIWVIQVKDPSANEYADSDTMPWMDMLIHIEDINESKELENLIMEANRREILKGRRRL